jgi:hypothetical protein
MSRPTLDEIQRWPASVSVPLAATALGISKSHAYELIQRDCMPVKTIKVGGRRVVVTADLIKALSADAA